MKNKGKEKLLSEKIVAVISVVTSLTVVVLAALQLFRVWDQAINVYMPLMGVTLLCQAYIQRNTSRKLAYFSVGTAVFIFICAIVVFFVK